MTTERQSPSGRFRPGIVRRSLQVTVDDLTAAAVTQTFNIGADLANSKLFQVLGCGCQVATEFSGGAATIATAGIGFAADPSSIAVFDVFTGATTNNQAPNTLGASPFYTQDGAQLQLLFTSDVLVNLLTAGDLTVNVVLAQLT